MYMYIQHTQIIRVGGDFMGREMERNMPEATLRNGRRQCNPIMERNKQLLLHTHTHYAHAIGKMTPNIQKHGESL